MSRSGPGGARHPPQQVPWTPLVWLVLWTTLMAGYLNGYASGTGLLQSPQFAMYWFGQLHPPWLNSKMTVDKAKMAAICQQIQGKIVWFFSLKPVVTSVACIPVAWITRAKGRRLSMMLGIAILMLGHILQGCAVAFSMLVIGQSMLGIASAFLYQATIIEAAEISPPGYRGAFTYSAYFGLACGAWSRGLLADGLSSKESDGWGWRVTALFVLWPATAAIMMVPFIPETPNSLIQRGQFEAGRAALQEIRGPSCDDRLMAAEYHSILKASTFGSQASHGTRSQFLTMTSRDQLPPLLLITLLAVFRELCGGHFVSYFLGQILLVTPWGNQQQSFLVLQVANMLQLIAVVVAIFTIDRWGRRASVGIAAVGCCVGAAGAAVAQSLMRRAIYEDQAGMALVISCVFVYVMFVFGIAGTYFLLSVELFPLATRSLAASLATGLANLFSAVTATFALHWLCTIEDSLAITYAVGSFLLLVVVVLLLPETKRVPLEDVHYLFRDHWVWCWFCSQGSRKLQTPSH